jgi:hypothetical protein
MGAAVGFQIWVLAVMLSVLNFGVVYLLSLLKDEVDHVTGAK